MLSEFGGYLPYFRDYGIFFKIIQGIWDTMIPHSRASIIAQIGLLIWICTVFLLGIFLFCLMLNTPVKSYGHVGTVSSPNHIFSQGKLD